jgi:HEAT repeat protein
MKAQDSIEEKLEKLGRAIGASDSIVENVMSRIKAAPIPDSKIRAAQNVWRTVTRSTFAKLATAAVIIIAVSIGLKIWLPDAGISVRTPVELAQMPVTALLDLYVRQSETHVNRAEVVTALKEAVADLSPADIVDTAAESTGTRAGLRLDAFRGRGDWEIPVSQVVEASDVVVEARVNEVILDSGDLVGVLATKYVSYACDQAELEGLKVDNDWRDALWNRCVDMLAEEYGPVDRYAEYFGKRPKATVELEIIAVYPLGIVQPGQKVLIRPVFDKEQVNFLEQGKEYVMGLRHHEGWFWLLAESIGMYPVDPNSGTVSGFIRCDLTSADEARSRTTLGSSSSEPSGSGSADERIVPIALDEAWQFVMDVYDAVHEAKHPQGEVLDYWLEKLQSDYFIDCWMAVEYLGTLAWPPVEPDTIIDAIERHLRISDGGDPDEDLPAYLNSYYQRTTFFTEALDLLLLVADEPAVDRMMVLYQQAVSSPEPIFHEVRENEDDLMVNMFRLALKHPGPKRRERFVSLFSLLVAQDDHQIRHELTRMVPWLFGAAEGGDIDQLLLDMSEDWAGFGISGVEYIEEYVGSIWAAAAKRALPEFGGYLEQVLAEPSTVIIESQDGQVNEEQIVELAQDAYHVHILAAHARGQVSREQAVETLVEQYRQGSRINDVGGAWDPVIDSIAQLIEAEDRQLIGFLRETLSSEEVIATIIVAEGMSDPSLVLAVKEALGERVTGELLEALFACGGQEEAIKMALAETDKPVNDDPELTDSVRIGYKFEDRARVIRFLGTTGDESLIPVVEHFTHEDVIEQFRQENPGGAVELQRGAVLALARLGGESVIPRLKQLYESGDIYIRILTALGLYYLGDETGYELLEHFVDHTERSVPEIEMEWDHWKRCGDMYEFPLMYLRSDRMEELLFARLHDLRHGFSTNFRSGDYGYGYAFLKEHKQQVLPVIVEQLDSKDREARQCANGTLKELTGRDFGFRKDRFAGQQDQVIQRWRAYIEEYLARNYDSRQ